jgi:bacterioferritin
MTTLERNSAPRASGEFVNDITDFRERAREVMKSGPSRSGHEIDLRREIDVLNELLGIELTFVLRFKRHFFTADRLDAPSAADEFLEDAAEESEHADRIAARIQQLGGRPDFYPDGLATRGQVEFDSLTDLEEMVREDAVAEQAAIATYREVIEWIGERDATTRRTLEEIVAAEEERTRDSRRLYTGVTY